MQQTNGPKGWHPMQRFLNEGSSEQGAVFLRADTEELSIKRNCTCANVVSNGSKKDH
ncbi:hypothetical protein EJ04DRAFT_511112 [Polyplosphaeria fusca]|uniref:Uncharacterized protein n=1 Tax=Polyplosphaeria fusca TaxID=682080 RepID=A0A9P4V3A8_9PLEO|nr:hypothetical protein EJ04DRAFT_511112 [Polyplosphaeria fusca]